MFQNCASNRPFISDHGQLTKKSSKKNMSKIEIYVSAFREKNEIIGFKKPVIFLKSCQ